MNAGNNLKQALAWAATNARADGQPRFLHRWFGNYWIDKEPSTQFWAGVTPETVTVAHPDGREETLASFLVNQGSNT